MLITFNISISSKELRGKMDEKPKFIVKLSRLWLFLSILLFAKTIFMGAWLIFIIFTTDKINDPSLYWGCMTYLLILVIALLCFSIISLKKQRSINKGDKSAIRGGFILSFVFLLIFGGITTYLIWSSLNSSWPIEIWLLSILILLFLSVIVNIAIIVISLSPPVKEFLKTKMLKQKI